MTQAQIGSVGGSWESLLYRIASGDRTAVTQLYDRSNRLAYGLALRMVGSQALAEEVTLDAYTEIWRSARQFDEKRGSAATWLCSVVRHRALDRVRAETRHREGREEIPAGIAAQGDPEEEAAVAQQRRAVRGSLETLNPAQRHTIELAYFDGLSHREIASVLGEPLGTIKARLRRGLLKLRDELVRLA